MPRINRFIIENVRCFKGVHELEIRPITFIVGENSTGKSTILGCIQAISDYMSSNSYESIDFNSPPYEMGSFGGIISRSELKEKNFKLGVEIDDFLSLQDHRKFRINFSFIENSDNAEPKIEKMKLTVSAADNNAKTTEIEVSIVDVNYDSIGVISKSDTVDIFDQAVSVEYDSNLNRYSVDFDPIFSRGNILSSFIQHFHRYKKSRDFQDYGDAKGQLVKFISENFHRRISNSEINVQSFSPIRSDPERTYNPMKEYSSNGDRNVPIILRNLSDNSPNKWDSMKSNFVEFAKKADLFSDMRIRNFTESKSDPFQLQFEIRGKFYNFADVGYGISQVLPILEGILSKLDTTKRFSSLEQFSDYHFLMQQPEVHLHPRAQVALISFMIEIYKQSSSTFIIETHSDYMVDRARIEIRRGNINYNDVSLVYLEAHGDGGVTVHNICFDEMGNMINVPDGYRSFFIGEAHSLFGFDS